MVKDNTTKYGVNANVSEQQPDFSGDYQARYGNNSNTSPILNGNSEPNPYAVNGNYGTVGNITAPPINPNSGIYQPGQMQPVPSSTQSTGGGGSGSSNTQKPVETTKINPDRNTQVVQLGDSLASRNGGGRSEQVSLYFYDPPVAKNDAGRIQRINYVNNPASAPRPDFGAVLPVKVLGRIHTLGTNGLARMELTRMVQGSWGTLPRGTMFVGRVSGGEGNRLFVSLIGYIDSRTDRLVTIGGDVQGTDGALGFEGDVKRVGSRWKKVFGELFSTVKDIGSSYLLGRAGGGGTIINNGNLSQLPNSIEGGGATRFVVVEAGSQGYIVISELPPALESDERLARSKRELSDEEILKMIQTESDEDVRRLIPKLSPDARKVALGAFGENKING